MPLGPGKYDALATYVRQKAKASGAMVMIFGGSKGEGFSIQASPELTLRLPELLRYIANEIERSMGTDAKAKEGT
jgi:hypothetical protein